MLYFKMHIIRLEQKTCGSPLFIHEKHISFFYVVKLNFLDLLGQEFET